MWPYWKSRTEADVAQVLIGWPVWAKDEYTVASVKEYGFVSTIW